jgi:hypothetical protein
MYTVEYLCKKYLYFCCAEHTNYFKRRASQFNTICAQNCTNLLTKLRTTVQNMCLYNGLWGVESSRQPS